MPFVLASYFESGEILRYEAIVIKVLLTVRNISKVIAQVQSYSELKAAPHGSRNYRKSHRTTCVTPRFPEL